MGIFLLYFANFVVLLQQFIYIRYIIKHKNNKI